MKMRKIYNFDISTDSCVKIFSILNYMVGIAQNQILLSKNCNLNHCTP